MGVIHYEKDERGLKRRVVSVDSKLVLLAECDKDRVKVNFIFEFGPESKEAIEELKRYASYLAINSRCGLLALMKYAEEPEKKLKRKDLLDDGLVYGTEGNYSSDLSVKNGRLYYNVELAAVGCWGTAYFDLGVATKNRVNLICRIVENFEEYLTCIVYTTKHNYIDNQGFEDDLYDLEDDTDELEDLDESDEWLEDRMEVLV